MPSKTPEEQARIAGIFILNFGAIEVITYRWIKSLSTDPILREVATEMPFNKRVALICKLINRSSYSPAIKDRSKSHWAEVSRIADTRNILAHSPLARSIEGGEWGYIDLKKMKGDGMPIEPLDFTEMERQALRLGALFGELFKPFGAVVVDGKGSEPV